MPFKNKKRSVKSTTFSVTMPIPIHDLMVEKGKALSMGRSAYIRYLVTKDIESDNKPSDIQEK